MTKLQKLAFIPIGSKSAPEAPSAPSSSRARGIKVGSVTHVTPQDVCLRPDLSSDAASAPAPIARTKKGKPATRAKRGRGKKVEEEEEEGDSAGANGSESKAVTKSILRTLDLTGLVQYVDFGTSLFYVVTTVRCSLLVFCARLAGPKGNLFLREMCSCSDTPTPTLLAQSMLANHSSYFRPTSPAANAASVDARTQTYLKLLGYLSVVSADIDRAVTARLQSEPWLLAYRKVREDEKKQSAAASASSSAGAADGKSADRTEIQILRADQIYISDAMELEFLLNPWRVPDVDLNLIALYRAFGARWLSECVTKLSQPETEGARESARSRELKETVRSRLPLLVHNQRMDPIRGIQKSMVQLLQSALAVKETDRIVTVLKFEGEKYEFR
jgi:hypothetical protein